MEKIKVMISGLPGRMATLIAEQVEKAKDMELLPFALAELEKQLKIGETPVACIPFPFANTRLKKAVKETPPDIIVDFTLPKSVNWNADLYCGLEIPFVMGTTGGDRDLLVKTVKESNISAVIAPNMAKQIVVFQAMMEYAAENFPGVFEGYSLKISESHQKSKIDTSGTAKAMVNYFNKLGIPFTEDQISKIRDPEIQRNKGVPEEYLNCHGWHTYTLQSKDKTIFFQFTHNVNGRNVYVQGALEAVRFLARHKNKRGKVFSMIDVLKNHTNPS